MCCSERPCHTYPHLNDTPRPTVYVCVVLHVQELAESKGVDLDQAGFETAMAAQRARSSASREAVDLTAAGPGLGQLAGQLEGGTVFEGYTDATLQLAGCKVVGLLVDGQPVDTISGQGGGISSWVGRGFKAGVSRGVGGGTTCGVCQ